MHNSNSPYYMASIFYDRIRIKMKNPSAFPSSSKKPGEDGGVLPPQIERPDPQDFFDIYDQNDILVDRTQLMLFKNGDIYKSSGEEAVLLERHLKNLIESQDWFYESQNYNFQDKRNRPITTITTSEIDDCFNHIDIVGIIQNKDTDFEPIPLGFDATYDFEYTHLKKKFSKQHSYGKKKNAPPEYLSEFGEAGSGYMPNKYAYGLGMPGIGSVKYFEDLSDKENPRLPKGRITMLPRLIIGIHGNHILNLDKNESEEELENLSPEEKAKRQRDKNMSQKKAKWCVLTECNIQIKDIRYLLEHPTDEELQYRGKYIQDALEIVKKVDKYFDSAIAKANQDAANDEDEAWAKDYAETKDVMVQHIREMSHYIYVERGWKDKKITKRFGQTALNALEQPEE